MPSANITALTNAAAFLPDALFYMAASPFGVTDDRKITGSTLFTTIAPLNNNTAALVVTNSAVPTVPQVVFTNSGGTRRMQVAMAGAFSITDTFDDVSIFSSIAAETLSLGLWNATDTGVGAELFLYTGAAGLAHLRIRATDGGAANGNFLDVPNSGVLFTSNASPGGLILCTDEATAPIIFAAGDNLFTAEKGRFDAAGFTLGHVSTITGALNLANSASAFLTTIQAGNAAAAVTYTWPTNVGAAGSVLTDAAGDGVLSWAAAGGGGVDPGLQFQIAYYPANGSTVDGNAGIFTNANNHLTVTPGDATPSTFTVTNSASAAKCQIGDYPFGSYAGIWLGPIPAPDGNNATFYSDANTELIINVATAAGAIRFRGAQASTPTPMTILAGSGAPSVGIGINSPATTLHVANTSASQTTLRVDGHATQPIALFTNTNANRFLFTAINPDCQLIQSAPNLATSIYGLIDEEITVNTGGATTDSTIDLPANSIILGVSARITGTITGVDSTTLQIGDPTTATRFNSTASALTAGTTIVGLNQMQGGIVTDATGPVQIATAKVRLTLAGGIDNTPTGGAVRITIHYIKLTASTQ